MSLSTDDKNGQEQQQQQSNSSSSLTSKSSGSNPNPQAQQQQSTGDKAISLLMKSLGPQIVKTGSRYKKKHCKYRNNKNKYNLKS
jgi:hypothetical protein